MILISNMACCQHGPGYATPLDAFNSGDKEKLIYVPCIISDHSRPDYLATVDVDPESPTYNQVIHRLHMPFNGDELHHTGWNACSSCFNDTSAQRKFLILPGFKSGRLYAVDVRDERAPKLHKYVDNKEISDATGLGYLHTSHCLGDGNIMVSALGHAADGSAVGNFVLIKGSDLSVVGKYAQEDTKYGYDFWYQPYFNTMVSTEFGTPSKFFEGFNPADVPTDYGSKIHIWNWKEHTLRQSIELGERGLIPLEVRFAHDPVKPWGYVGAALSSSIVYLEVDQISKEVSHSFAIEQPWAEVTGWALPTLPPLITDILLSLDDKYLFFSNWLRGDIVLYDISDPKHPVLKDRIFVGGSILKGGSVGVSAKSLAEFGLTEQPEQLVVKGVPIQGGPQMLQLSLDGNRLYVTNSLVSPWDKQFYGGSLVAKGSQLIRLNVDQIHGKLSIDETFVIDFGAEPDGPVLAHECRYPGGDCSSDIWLAPGTTWFD